jgi:hypothetical protein
VLPFRSGCTSSAECEPPRRAAPDSAPTRGAMKELIAQALELAFRSPGCLIEPPLTGPHRVRVRLDPLLPPICRLSRLCSNSTNLTRFGAVERRDLGPGIEMRPRVLHEHRICAFRAAVLTRLRGSRRIRRLEADDDLHTSAPIEQRADDAGSRRFRRPGAHGDPAGLWSRGTAGPAGSAGSAGRLTGRLHGRPDPHGPRRILRAVTGPLRPDSARSSAARP